MGGEPNPSDCENSGGREQTQSLIAAARNAAEPRSSPELSPSKARSKQNDLKRTSLLRVVPKELRYTHTQKALSVKPSATRNLRDSQTCTETCKRRTQKGQIPEEAFPILSSQRLLWSPSLTASNSAQLGPWASNTPPISQARQRAFCVVLRQCES